MLFISLPSPSSQQAEPCRSIHIVTFRSSSADDPLVLNCTPPTNFCREGWLLTLAPLPVPYIAERERAPQPHKRSSLSYRLFILSQALRTRAQPSAQPAHTMSNAIMSRKNAFSNKTSTPAVRSPALLAMPSVSVKYKHDAVVATTV